MLRRLLYLRHRRTCENRGRQQCKQARAGSRTKCEFKPRRTAELHRDSSQLELAELSASGFWPVVACRAEHFFPHVTHWCLDEVPLSFICQEKKRERQQESRTQLLTSGPTPKVTGDELYNCDDCLSTQKRLWVPVSRRCHLLAANFCDSAKIVRMSRKAFQQRLRQEEYIRRGDDTHRVERNSNLF